MPPCPIIPGAKPCSCHPKPGVITAYAKGVVTRFRANETDPHWPEFINVGKTGYAAYLSSLEGTHGVEKSGADRLNHRQEGKSLEVKEVLRTGSDSLTLTRCVVLREKCATARKSVGWWGRLKSKIVGEKEEVGGHMYRVI